MSVIPPGGRLGVLGGGQLARMLGLEARRMGYGFVVVADDPACPAACVADRVLPMSSVETEVGLEELANAVDVVTLETEHIAVPLLRRVEQRLLLRPGSAVLATISDRLHQRRFLKTHGVAQPAFISVSDLDELAAARRAAGFPAVLKTRQGGYDGRGQARVDREDDLSAAWDKLGRLPCVLEEFVPFTREISVIAARSGAGELRFYPVAENEHRHHVLHRTLAPAVSSPACLAEAQSIAATIAGAFDYVGVFAVELFVCKDDTLLVNEVAPRVHNTGHFTWGGCVTSQFEQHVRAICGLPLGDPSPLRASIMLNLLGDLWQAGEPSWTPLLSLEGVSLHLYGKREARPRRKMGHVLVTAPDAARALSVAERVNVHLDALGTGAPPSA